MLTDEQIRRYELHARGMASHVIAADVLELLAEVRRLRAELATLRPLAEAAVAVAEHRAPEHTLHYAAQGYAESLKAASAAKAA